MQTKQKLIQKKLLLSFLLLSFFIAFGQQINAQNTITVKGVVTSIDDGALLPGVSVVNATTKIGTSTDFDGVYTIKAKIGEVLTFAYLGMREMKIKVTSATLNVKLESSAEALDEIVVIGYGTVKKKELTGAVAQVKSEAIEQFVTTDVAAALQGQIAGVSVVSSSGEPGQQSSIQIRGVTSISGSNTPLWVVDGIPQVGDPGLNMNEIETFDILKDGASTAVYGSRGAAGVILVTTKKGKSGSMKVNFKHSYGVQVLGEDAPLMNAAEQIAFETTKESLGITPNHITILNNNPDWYNNDNDFSQYVLNETAATTNYSLNVSGGSDKLTYNFSGGYLGTEGALVNSSLKRYNGRTSTTYRTDKWKINSSIAFTIDKNERPNNGLLATASRYAPYFPLINSSVNTIFTTDDGAVTTPLNNLAQALKRQNTVRTDVLNGSLDITRNITQNLSVNSRVGFSTRNQLQKIFVPAFSLVDPDNPDEVETDPTKSLVNSEASRLSKFSWDASLNYKKKIGGHTFGALGALTLEEDTYEGFFGQKQGVTDNAIAVLNTATLFPTTANLLGYNIGRVGTLGRLQYNYKGKYLFSVLGRYDGSSQFSSNNKWGFFPSASAAWNVSDESFWDPIKSVINNFKIRASYGEVGYDQIPSYGFSSTIAQGTDYIFSDTDGTYNNGTAIRDYANEELKWETSKSVNIGVDLGFLRNKFVVTAEYYNTKKEDMLLAVPLPASTGAFLQNNSPNGENNHTTVIQNVGNMTNQGFELAARYTDKIGESRLSINATFSKNINEITHLYGDTEFINTTNSSLVTGDTQNSLITRYAKGYEAGAFFIYETNGVVQTDEQLIEYQKLKGREGAVKGDLMYVDTNNDGEITAEDKVYKGSGLPDFEIGFNLNWRYKNFDLAMNWFGSVGAEIMNGNKAVSYIAGRHPDLSNMWTETNSTSNVPNWSGGKGDLNHNGNTDYWLENGDYLRLKLITLGYSLPKNVLEKINVSNLKLFVSAQNPITITGYEGYDPEIGGNVARRGLDVSRYPISALYSLGFNIGF